MPDGLVPFDNLWGVAVLRFGQQSSEAWRMTTREVWHLVDMSDGGPKTEATMSKKEFEEMKQRLGA